MTISTAGSLGTGSVSRVNLAGMKKRMRHLPSAARAWATGAVIAISSEAGDCATGAVMSMLVLPWLPPKM